MKAAVANVGIATFLNFQPLNQALTEGPARAPAFIEQPIGTPV